MKDWFKKRSKEGSTFVGLGMLLGAAGVLLKAPELEQAGSVVTQQSDLLTDVENNWPVLLAALAGVFMPTSAFKRN